MIDWKNLPFGYLPTHANIRCTYKNGTWGEIRVHTEETINLHIAATSLHYGQECFEGLKAYRGFDEKIRLFRWKDNAIRMQKSATKIGMPAPPIELFEKAIHELIVRNKEFVPPYGSGASLYIRPFLIGTEGKLGLDASKEYEFIVFCSPVGPYFKDGFKPVQVVLEYDSDRAAPLGTGNVKVGGNYAASVSASAQAKNLGYSAVLYLDSKEKKYIDECGPANFFAIRNNTYITPKSTSILESITNKSLMTLAEKMGMNVEYRPVAAEELSSFEEVGQCGTAAVLTPIYSIHDPLHKKDYIYSTANEVGETSTKLYKTLVDIQYGIETDTEGWITIVE